MNGQQFMDLISGVLFFVIFPWAMAYLFVCIGISEKKKTKASPAVLCKLPAGEVSDYTAHNRIVSRIEYVVAAYFVVVGFTGIASHLISSILMLLFALPGISLLRWVYRQTCGKFFHVDGEKTPEATKQNLIRELTKNKVGDGSLFDDSGKFVFDNLGYNLWNESLFIITARLISGFCRAIFRKIRIPTFRVRDRYYWICCLGLAMVSLLIGFLLNGTWDLAGLMLDMPFISYQSFLESVGGNSQFYLPYVAISVSITMLVMSLIKYFLLGPEEYPIHTMRGFTFWLMSFLISVVVDSQAMNLVIWYVSVNPDATNIVLYLIYSILITVCVCFVFSDAMINLITVWLSFFLVRGLLIYTPFAQWVSSTVFQMLIVAFGLRLIFALLEKLGLMDKLIRLIHRIFTPKFYVPLTFLVALPAVIVVELIRLFG